MTPSTDLILLAAASLVALIVCIVWIEWEARNGR